MSIPIKGAAPQIPMPLTDYVGPVKAIPGLVTWLTPDPQNVTVENGVVTAIAARAGAMKGLTLARGTPKIARPSFNPDLDWMSHDGSDADAGDSLSGTSSFSYDPAAGLTVVTLALSNNPSGSPLFGCFEGANNIIGGALTTGGGTYNYVAPNQPAVTTSGSGLTSGAAHIFSWRLTGTALAVTVGAKRTDLTVPATAATASARLIVGSRYLPSNSVGFLGFWAEFWAFNRAITDAELAKISAYIGETYGGAFTQ